MQVEQNFVLDQSIDTHVWVRRRRIVCCVPMECGLLHIMLVHGNIIFMLFFLSERLDIFGFSFILENTKRKLFQLI